MGQAGAFLFDLSSIIDLLNLRAVFPILTAAPFCFSSGYLALSLRWLTVPLKRGASHGLGVAVKIQPHPTAPQKVWKVMNHVCPALVAQCAAYLFYFGLLSCFYWCI